MAIAEVQECEGDDCADTATGSEDTNTTAPVTFCPFRDKLVIAADGTATVTTNDTQYEDGSYNQITLVSGCVSGLDTVAARGYIPNNCCPETADGEATTYTAAPDACNLTSVTGTEVLTRAYFSDTTGYQVSGCGTADSPWTIEGPSVPEIALETEQCTNNASIVISGLGTSDSPLRVCHKSGVLPAGTYEGITLDATGHVTNVNIADAENHNTYISDDFIIIETDTPNEYKISKKPVTTGQTISISGYQVTYDDYGDITNVTGADDGTGAGTSTGMTTTLGYTKADGTTGTMAFNNGLLTSVT